MKKILQLTFWPIIIIGVVAASQFFLTGQFTDLSVIKINSVQYGSYTWTYYYFDSYQYLTNLKLAVVDNSLAKIIPDAPTLPTIPNTADIIDWLKYIVNIIGIYSLNMMSFMYTIILFAPIKILFYPVKIILVLLGYNTSNSAFTSVFDYIYSFNLGTLKYI